MEIKVDNFDRPIKQYIIPEETIECHLSNDYILLLNGSTDGGKSVNVGKLTIKNCYIDRADLLNIQAKEIRIKDSYIGTICGTGMNAEVFDASGLYTENAWLLKSNIGHLYPPSYCNETFDLSSSEIKMFVLQKDCDIHTIHLDGAKIGQVNGNGYLIKTKSYNYDSKTQIPSDLDTILGLGKYKFQYRPRPRLVA